MAPTKGKSCEQGGLFQRIGREIPNARFLGFAFWVAWFGLAYTSSVWVSEKEATSSVISEMFLVSTLFHAACWIVFAFLSRRGVAAWASRAPFVLIGGIGASLGCVFVLAAGPSYAHSHLMFLAGSAMTGIGTAAIGVRAGLCLCSVDLKKAFLTVLSCVILSAFFQFMVRGVPFPCDQVLFCILPACSSLFMLAEPGNPAAMENAESQRILPSRAYGRLLTAIGILGVVAYYGTGQYQQETYPSLLADAGSLTSLLTIVCCAGVYLAQALRGGGFEFSHLFYPLVALIVASLLGSYFLPERAEVGIVLSGTVFQMFDVGMWYVFACVVQQSKTSSVFVVSLGRAAIAVGVTLGSLLGRFTTMGENGEITRTAVFLLLFASALVVLLIFPEKQSMRLLLPIPDEDDAAQSPEIVGNAAADEGDGEEDPLNERERVGRWKRSCYELADSKGLTEREKEVLVLLARGYGSQTISDKLTISLYTTRAHTRNIYSKLDVHSRQELCELVNEHAVGAE